MNRHQRRAAKKTSAIPPGAKFRAKCEMCRADSCPIHVIERHGQDDLGICKGCPCSVDKCDWCGRQGEHWLGCQAVGLPSENPDRPPC